MRVLSEFVSVRFARRDRGGGARRAASRLELEASSGAFEHYAGCGDLVIGAGRRRLDVNDDSVLGINQMSTRLFVFVVYADDGSLGEITSEALRSDEASPLPSELSTVPAIHLVP